jgi:pimeloyl-ACP methyl ester carboxylesterase
LPISEEIARAIPGSEFVAVPDCGHLIENEREDEFLQSVSNFIGCHRAETGRWL